MKLKLCQTQWENANVWLGHVPRHESLLHDIINRGKNEGKGAKQGRKKMHLLSDLMKQNYMALKRTAEDRKEWQKLKTAGSQTLACQQIT